MSENSPLNPESEAERKARERREFERYFTKEKEKEEGNTRTAMIWVLIFGVGIPLLFSILYVIVSVILGLAGAL